MAFSIYIDGRYLDQPEIEDLEFTIERGGISNDSYFEGLISSFELSDISFYGTASEYIREQWTINNGCGELYVLIVADCCEKQKYEGIIQLADTQIHDCKVVCSIIDNGFGSRVKQNKSIAVNLNSKVGKDGNPISGIVTSDYTMKATQPSTSDVSIQGWKLKDVTNHIIQSITSGQISVDSTLLDEDKYIITSGWNLYYGQTTTVNAKTPEISLETIITTLKKLFCANWSLSSTTLKIEHADFFYNSLPYQSIAAPKDYVSGICDDLVYSGVKIGDNQNLNFLYGGGITNDADPPAQTRLLSQPKADKSSHYPISFTSTNDCANSTVLDLSSDDINWSSNLIEHLLFTEWTDEEITSNEDLLNSIFIIEVNGLNESVIETNSFVFDEIASTTLFKTYNPSLTNGSILNAWDGYLPDNMLASVLCETTFGEGANDGAESIIDAVYNSTGATALPMVFINDEGNYNKTDNEYLCKKSGLYTVLINYEIKSSFIPPASLSYFPRHKIFRTDGDIDNFEAQSEQVFMIVPNTYYGVNYTYTTYLNEGEIFVPQIVVSSTAGSDAEIKASGSTRFQIINICESDYTSTINQLKLCSTFESIQSICSINDLIDNGDRTMLLPRGAEFIKKVIVNAKTGISQWDGISRFAP